VDVASETAQIGVAVGNVAEEDQMAAGMPPDTSEPQQAEDLVVTSGRSSLDRSLTTTDLALVGRPTVADKLGEVGEARPEGKPKAQNAKFAERGSVTTEEPTIDPKEMKLLQISLGRNLWLVKGISSFLLIHSI